MAYDKWSKQDNILKGVRIGKIVVDELDEKTGEVKQRTKHPFSGIVSCYLLEGEVTRAPDSGYNVIAYHIPDGQVWKDKCLPEEGGRALGKIFEIKKAASGTYINIRGGNAVSTTDLLSEEDF